MTVKRMDPPSLFETAMRVLTGLIVLDDADEVLNMDDMSTFEKVALGYCIGVGWVSMRDDGFCEVTTTGRAHIEPPTRLS